MSRTQHEFSPLRVFVVWHPSFSSGARLFEALYDWLGGPGGDLYHRGLGVPVHPLTSPDAAVPPEAPPLTTQSLSVVVALVDEELIGRRAWRQWLDDLAGNEAIVVLPWAVHMAATNLSKLRHLHLLGAGECLTYQLLRRVTEACVVRVRDLARTPWKCDDPSRPEPLRIFLSYARGDGLPVAQEVQKAMQAYGHLSVFLDEHELQPGVRWREDLARELNDGAAMFAIVTDLYASRAWCRKELRDFRAPRREGTSNQWSLRPVFILDHLQGAATRSMFEVGSAPAARWDPARAGTLVDELVREVLFSEMNRVRATHIVADPTTVQIVNWIPDTWTLIQVLGGAQATTRIAYPGDGLPGSEIRRLEQLFARDEGDVRTGPTLVSFEDVSNDSDRLGADRSPRPAVLLSVSDPSPADLAKRGLHMRHLDDAAVRLARAVLYEGYDVMYGGRPRSGFTRGLQDNSETVVLEARLLNHLGWPYNQELDARQVADGFGITRYVPIDCEIPTDTPVADPWYRAVAARATRRAAAAAELRDLDEARVPPRVGVVALGGQMNGFRGFLPGIAEEVAMAMEAGLAIYVLGGFGGAAAMVARVLEDRDASAFRLDALAASETFRELQRAAQDRGEENQLARHVAWLVEVLLSVPPENGLTAIENTELRTTGNFGRAVALVSKGLRGMGR